MLLQQWRRSWRRQSKGAVMMIMSQVIKWGRRLSYKKQRPWPNNVNYRLTGRAFNIAASATVTSSPGSKALNILKTRKKWLHRWEQTLFKNWEVGSKLLNNQLTTKEIPSKQTLKITFMWIYIMFLIENIWQVAVMHVSALKRAK